MGIDAGTPPGLRETIARLVDDRLAQFARSGFLRNASISDGGLTIKGGFLRLLTKATGGVNLLYAGPTGTPLPDGSYQQVIVISRADGSQALALHDAFPGVDGTLNQALTWRDRAGNVVLADDTDSGQGLARPWLAGGFARARYADMTISTTSSTFETLWSAYVDKFQPRLQVTYRATMDTAGTTGETRVLVNNVPLGPVVAEAFLNSFHTVGPADVAGSHTSELLIEIQGRCISASGALRVEAYGWRGRQT